MLATGLVGVVVTAAGRPWRAQPYQATGLAVTESEAAPRFEQSIAQIVVERSSGAAAQRTARVGELACICTCSGSGRGLGSLLAFFQITLFYGRPVRRRVARQYRGPRISRKASKLQGESSLAGRAMLGRSMAWRLLIPVLLAMLAGCGSEPRPRRDVLLITVDTLRADFVHAYGFAAPITPAIDELAGRGVRFESAIASSSATAPSVASIMTSRFTREHSVGALNGPTRLVGDETLAERFRAAGYETAAFVSNVVLKSRSGFDRGFDVFDDDLPGAEANRPALLERRAATTAERALDWLAERGERPFFLWVHFQDPHGPYLPPGEVPPVRVEIPLRTDRPLSVLSSNRGRGGIPAYQHQDGLVRPGDYARRYAGEIAYVDGWVGRVVDAFEARSGERGSVVLFTADHGESLGENGWFFQHGHATTPELARVPLVLVAQGLEPAVRSEPVSHVDIAPTLLELAGVDPLERASGLSLAALLDGGVLPERLLFCDVPGELSAYGPAGYVMVSGWPGDSSPGSALAAAGDSLDWQRWEADDAGGWRRSDDPAQLDAEIARYLASAAAVEPALPMSDEDISRLRALGYLPPDSAPSGN